MEKPNWEPGDGLRSMVDVVHLGVEAAKVLMAKAIGWLAPVEEEPPHDG